MAGGYIIDPATGQAGVQTASGGFLPLPMSADQLGAAGLPPGMPGPPGAPQAPPPSVPGTEVAGPGGGYMFGVPGIAPPSSNSLPTEEIKKGIGWVDQQPAAPGSPRAAEIAASQPPPAQGAPVAQAVPERVHAAPLGGEQQQAPASNPSQEAGMAAFQDYMRGGGGGAPRGLGVAGETRKYSTFQNPGGDPTKVAAAEEALGASDKYGEGLAKSLNIRQQQAYEAQQAEFADRSGQMAAQQQRFDDQQRMLQDYQGKRDAVMQEAAQLKTPQMEDYWGSRGTFANVMTGLSIALGGALQGLRGGQNPGLEMSNQSIDRWIAGQQEAYRRAEGRVTDADNQYAKMVQTFGNENLATSHLREQAWAVRDGMLQSYAQKIGTPSALEAYNNAMLQTEAQWAALRAQNSQGAQVDIEQKLSMQGGGGKPKTLAEAYKVAAETKKNADILNGTEGGGEKNAVILPDGSTAYAPSGAEQQRAQGVIRSADEAARMLDRLDKLTQAAGGRALTEDERGQAETLKAELMPALQGVHGFKRLTDADLHLLQEMTGDPIAFARNPNARARLHELKRGVLESSETTLKYLRRKPIAGSTETAAPAGPPGAQDEGDD